MYKVLITTSILTPNVCHASSIVVEFPSKSDAEDAVSNARENGCGILTVAAILLNPDYR